MAEVDKMIMEKYLPLIPLYYSASNYPVGKNLGHVINDPTQGLPEFTSIFLKQP
jgi:peptide/nickel transport system substrate-binding protein